MISQSAIRTFNDPDYCDILWEESYLNGWRSYPSKAMLHGLYFEQYVIGSTRGGEVYELPKLKSGKPSKEQTDLDKLIESAKKTIDNLGIKILEVQPEWKHDDIIGHPDALIEINGDRAIMDLKYTGTREDESCRWNPYAWGKDLELKDYSQAVHYVEMYYRMHGEYLPFFYLVFGKSGWVKFISIDITEQTLDDYRDTIKRFRADLSDFTPKPSTDYNKCEKCPLQCSKRADKPNIINIEY